MANVGEQFKKMLADLKALWAKQDKKRKRIALIAGGALLAFVLGITLLLNWGSGGYEILYSGMETGEAAQVYAALQGFEAPVAARMNKNGEVEVPKKDKDRALAELALQGIPKSGLPYDIFPGTGSLTSTDLEKRKQIEYQLNNRLQDTLRQFPDVKNAIVTISLSQGNNKVWETQTNKSTASVTLHLQPGVTYSKDNVTAIRRLVASSVGYTMDPKDVMVIDAATSMSLRGREDTDGNNIEAELERLGLQDTIDSRFADKVSNVVSLIIPPDKFRVTTSIQIDYDKVVKEIKEYQPSPDGNNSGIKEHEIGSGVMGPGNLANGLPGEEENTDPQLYVDNNGDGTPDVVDYTFDTEYAVSYIMTQIEQDQSKVLTENSSVAVAINGDIDEDSRQKIIELAAKATGIPEARVTVHNFVLGDIGGDDKPVQGFTLEGPVLYVAIGCVAGLLLLLILIMILSSKSKKKKLAAAAAAAEAASAGTKSPNMEISSAGMSDRELEERKRMIQDAAQRAKNDNAITEEVREFAKQNPQITANLLRSWLKEDEG